MELPPSHVIHQTEHWILNHHLASALPGYLMLGARSGAGSLADLPVAALAELGGLLATTQQLTFDRTGDRAVAVGFLASALRSIAGKASSHRGALRWLFQGLGQLPDCGVDFTGCQR